MKKRPLWDAVLVGIVLSVVVYLVLVPLIYLFWVSLHKAVPLGEYSPIGLYNYRDAYLDPVTYELLANSLLFASGTATVAMFFGTALAWLFERTNIPYRQFLVAVVIIPLVIPGVLFAISWVLLLSPDIGLINLFIMKLLGLKNAPLNIFTLEGMIFVEGLQLTPVVFLMVAGAFRSMDRSLEEAAYIAGAPILTTLHRITLKIATPALLSAFIYVFITGLSSLELPLVIGMRAGIHVFTLKIWMANEYSTPPDYGMISTLAMILLLLCSIGIYLYGRLTRQTERFVSVTGKGYRPLIINLGSWKYVTLAFVATYVLFAVILPFFILIWASLLPFYSIPSMESLSRISLVSYGKIFTHPVVPVALRNTLLLVIISPPITMLLSSILSWLSVRKKVPASALLDTIAFLPHGIPPIVISAALMLAYLSIPIPIYGTIWILMVAYTTKEIAWGTRTMNAAVIQISPELEEAAQASGASSTSTFIRITLPLLAPSFLNGWLFMGMLIAKALGTIILLYSTTSVVLPVVIWELWMDGKTSYTAALGVLLITFILVINLFARTRKVGVVANG